MFTLFLFFISYIYINLKSIITNITSLFSSPSNKYCHLTLRISFGQTFFQLIDRPFFWIRKRKRKDQTIYDTFDMREKKKHPTSHFKDPSFYYYYYFLLNLKRYETGSKHPCKIIINFSFMYLEILPHWHSTCYFLW